MRLRNCTFPYPVMSPWSEDVPYTFDFDVQVKPQAASYSIWYQLDTTNETFKQLIDEGAAIPVIHIESVADFYRETHVATLSEFESEKGVLEIDAENCNGRMVVSSFICAAQDIEGYRNERQHADYGDNTFQIRKGDYLAIGPAHEFFAEKGYDPLKKLASFIKISRGPEGVDKPARVDFTAEKVKIILPNKLYQEYANLQDHPGCKETISTLILLPVLVQLVAEMRVANCEFSELMWHKGLQRRFEMVGVDLGKTSQSNYELAQLLFDLPLRRTSVEMQNLTGS